MFGKFNGTNIINGLDCGDLKVSEYVYARIIIKTDYSYSNGWNSYQYLCFKNSLYPSLEIVGFKVENGPCVGSCEHLKSCKNKGTNLYMHPLEFSGYITKEELETLIKVLEEDESVYDVSSVTTEVAYELNDYQYKRILSYNIKFIEEFILKETKRGCPVYNVGFEFGRKYFIRGVGSSDVLGSNRIDIDFVNSYAMCMLAKGELGDKKC